jgi:hypothetical protein
LERKKGDIFSTQQVVFGTVYVGLDQVSKGHWGDISGVHRSFLKDSAGHVSSFYW